VTGGHLAHEESPPPRSEIHNQGPRHAGRSEGSESACCELAGSMSYVLAAHKSHTDQTAMERVEMGAVSPNVRTKRARVAINAASPYGLSVEGRT
jgi:hypothetical protein